MPERYLTHAEFVDRAGQARIDRVVSRDGRRDAIDRALAQAEGEVTSYLLSRYGNQLPTTPVATPEVLKGKLVSMALYYLASHRVDVVAPEWEAAHGAAVRFLQLVARGVADLGLDARPAVDDGTPGYHANRSTADMVFANGGLEDW